MKKKVKKIPKYNVGTLKVIDPNVLNSAMAGRFTTVPSVDTTGKIGTGINAGIGLLETATSGQDVTVGGAAKSTLSGAAAGLQMGGPVGAAVGAALGLAAGTAGRTNKVDYNSNSTNIKDIAQEGSGWLKAFGMSDEEMMKRASYTQNTNIGKIKTEQMRADYYSDPYNPNGAMALVAEGGVIRQPVDALVSKGELIYNPITKKLSKVPGSKGKANKKDDVYAKLQEGDMVISNSPTMLMSNGKTPALNLEGLVDNDKNMKAKEAIIKKVVNWLEANRTEPQEYAMYHNGTPEVVKLGEDPITDKLMAELMKPVVPKITSKSRKGLKFLNKMFDTASDYAPVLAALAKNTDYDVEQAYINPVKYLPTGVSIAPLKRSAEESLAIGRYNLARINPNTGAGMAYGLQAATNRAKALADAYTWQQDTQNKLIAQNVGIYNDWSAREAQARHTAAVETSQNAAAAQLMKDQAMKDAYEFKTGRRNDRWKLSMLEPLFNYAVDNNIWRNFKIV